jgi:cbb3-type cytochrome oxidase subunit 3
MSDTPSLPARPVSLFSVVFVLALFALFLLVIRWAYQPATVSPQNAAAENLPKDQEWRATAASRRKAYEEQRAAEVKQATAYAWVDKNAGVVQLPIERAMELTAHKYGAKK